jgi:uncharacterized membrane protein
MSIGTMVGSVNLFLTGLLAGEEFVIRYGVRAPVASLDRRAHIVLRQRLIRRLRILVPALAGPTILTGLLSTLLDRRDRWIALRGAGLLSLFVLAGVTLLGTVPINAAVLEWDPDAPPADWQAQIGRWEQLDVVRCWAAVLAFALFVAAAGRPTKR